MTNSPPKTPSLHLTAPNFDITLIVVEVSRNIMPAVRFQVSCTLQHPSSTFSYQADDIWIDFETLDQFIGELGGIINHLQGAATLMCLAKMFKFELSKQDQRITANIAIAAYRPERHTTRLTASFPVEQPEVIDTWYRSFSEFRR